MKLTIEHLAAYLPYEVKINLNRPLFERTDINLMGLTIAFNSSTNEHFIIKSEVTYGLEHIQPLLRPLSDLTKEIEHNGERFVPIEWFEIGDDSNYSVEYDNGNIKLIRALESLSKNGFANEVEYFPYGVITKLLSWHFDIYSLIPQGLAIPIKPINNEQQD